MGRRSRAIASSPLRVSLIDTSAWIEFLRDIGSGVCERVDALLEHEFGVCDPIRGRRAVSSLARR